MKNDERCWLCKTNFRSLKNPFGAGSYNCTKCGNSICENCSFKPSSIAKETKPQRVCNHCGTA